MEAPVNVDDLPGGHRRPIRQEHTNHPRHRLGVRGVPAEGGPFVPEVVKNLKSRDRLGRDSLEWPRRDQVGPNPVLPEVSGEVAANRLESGLGDPHPVVRRPGHSIVEVEADESAPSGLLHQGKSCHGQRLEGEGGGEESSLGRRRGRVEKVPTEGVTGGKGYGVDGAVDHSPTLGQVGHDPRHVLLVGDVHLEHRHRLGQSLHGAFGQAQPASEVGHHHFGAFLEGNAGDVKRNGVVGCYPRDEEFLSLQQQTCVLSEGPVTIFRNCGQRS